MKISTIAFIVLGFSTSVFAQSPAAPLNLPHDGSAASSEAIVEGKVAWGSKITEEQKKLKPGAVMYIFAKEGPQGPPLVVKRIAQPFSMPYTFSLTTEDMMIKGVKAPLVVKVTARISQSGSAMPVSPGDIEGVTPKPVKRGAKGVSVELNTIK